MHDEAERRGSAVNCLVSGGCIVSGGSVRSSLLFSNVHVRSYSDVEQSVILPGVVINRRVKIRKAVIDSGTILPEGTEVGVDPDADRERGFRVSDEGVTLVTPDHFGQLLHRVR